MCETRSLLDLLYKVMDHLKAPTHSINYEKIWTIILRFESNKYCLEENSKISTNVRISTDSFV